ncbi:MAG: 50S ribosomal protein L10 [Candidatus Niyogibacteria bacterium CG10_big_fil_rev_8_21_14_0_10_42_19]|uniref:Large ribosomal subunit protein uL10 n=1 Tax=Candidatus Niyogibacteria bacterium CG10_big_fil_rev_8_21_14_0_10_42_19 TaxID=1974725 RepID=A0A2H0TGJ9_9BACT|nr:MAG: 50S ribosomal protein L10 [Candidatus Niyogibacteria bacterium CG10_big_fil_rev_8_21_14_0_10_42_19]
MAITRAKKEEIVREVHQKMEKAKAVVFLNFHGLNVVKISELRKALREVGADIKVAKKRLVKRVADGLRLSGEPPVLEGELALMFEPSEELNALKIIQKFTKNKAFEGMKILGGIFDNNYINIGAVRALASIPPKEVLIGQLVSTIASPLSGFVRVLNGPMRNLVGVLNNLSNKK